VFAQGLLPLFAAWWCLWLLDVTWQQVWLFASPVAALFFVALPTAAPCVNDPVVDMCTADLQA
jgi:hypothetical protein